MAMRNKLADSGDYADDQQAAIARVRQTLEQERFALSVEQIQEYFQDVHEPFAILPRAGVFLSNGKNYVVMAEAFIELWNHTARARFDFLTPLEKFRQSRAADPTLSVDTALKECLVCVSAHNLHLLRE